MNTVINTIDIDYNQYKKIPIIIEFPRNWYPHVRTSLFEKTIESETIKWMTEYQIISSKEEESTVKEFEISKYAGYPGCMFNYEYALLNSKMITLWLLWDDVEVEGISNPSYYSNLIELLSEPSDTVSGDRFICAWKHIGDEITRLGGTNEFRKRFGKSIDGWIDSACKETKFLSQKSENISFENVLDSRRLTIGMDPTCILAERGTGIELPQYVLDAIGPAYASIALTVSLVNDLVSVPKDLKKGTLSSNCVLWYMAKNSCPLSEAYTHILSLLASNISKFDHIASHILSNIGKEWYERVMVYFNTLRYISSGFAQWHIECQRYLKYTVKG